MLRTLRLLHGASAPGALGPPRRRLAGSVLRCTHSDPTRRHPAGTREVPPAAARWRWGSAAGQAPGRPSGSLLPGCGQTPTFPLCSRKTAVCPLAAGLAQVSPGERRTRGDSWRGGGPSRGDRPEPALLPLQESLLPSRPGTPRRTWCPGRAAPARTADRASGRRGRRVFPVSPRGAPCVCSQDARPVGFGPTLMTSFSLSHTFIKALSPRRVTS